MNKCDIQKFLNKNLKCPKSKQILNEIEKKYGFEYKIGALLGEPKKYTLYELMYKDITKIYYNSGMQASNFVKNFEDELITPNKCLIIPLTRGTTQATFYSDFLKNYSAIMCFNISASFPNLENFNLNLRFAENDSGGDIREIKTINNITFGWKDYPINANEIINFGNFLVTNGITKNYQKLFGNNVELIETDINDLNIFFHTTYDKKNFLYSICIFKIENDQIKIIVSETNIRVPIKEQGNHTIEEIWKEMKIYLNLNSNQNTLLTNLDGVNIQFINWRLASFREGLKPFLDKIIIPKL